MNYEGFWSVKGFISHTFFNGYHPFFPWFTFILFGLLLSRYNFSDKRKIISLTSISIITALVLECISALLINYFGNSEIAVFLFSTKPMNPTFLYVFTATAWAIFFIGLCILLERKFKASRWYQLIVKTGQMALTHYVIHVIGVLGVMVLIDNLAYHDEIFVLFISLFAFLLMLLFSNVWSLKFNKGPIELFMRRITQ